MWKWFAVVVLVVAGFAAPVAAAHARPTPFARFKVERIYDGDCFTFGNCPPCDRPGTSYNVQILSVHRSGWQWVTTALYTPCTS